jgi:hypothetical protein
MQRLPDCKVEISIILHVLDQLVAIIANVISGCGTISTRYGAKSLCMRGCPLLRGSGWGDRFTGLATLESYRKCSATTSAKLIGLLLKSRMCSSAIETLLATISARAAKLGCLGA